MQRKQLFFLCFIVFLSLGMLWNSKFNSAVYGQASSNWGQFHGDASHNGFANSIGPVNPIEIWNNSLGYTNTGLIAGNGLVIFSAPSTSVTPVTYGALSETKGAHLYNIQYLPPADSYAAIGGNSVYSIHNNWLGQCDLSNGNYGSWGYSIPSGSKTSEFYGSAGVAYYLGLAFGVSFGNTAVTACSASSGTLNWQRNLAGAIDTIPTIGNGVLVVGFSNLQQVSALSSNAGTSLWTFTVDGVVDASPAYDSSNFFFGTMNGTFYSISQSGQQTWSDHIGSAIETTPAIANGLVYFGTDNGTLFALNSSTGTLAWEYSTTSELLSPPVVASNGIVYQATTDGSLIAFDSTNGKKLWTYNLESGVIASPVLDAGYLFLVDSNGIVYAFGDTNSGSSPSPSSTLMSSTATASPSSASQSPSPSSVNSARSSSSSSPSTPSASPQETLSVPIITLFATVLTILVAVPVTVLGIVEHRKRERCEKNKNILLKKITEAKTDIELFKLKDEIAEELKQEKITNDGHDALDRVIDDKRLKLKLRY